MEKIALIFGCDKSRNELTMLGRTQAGYLIQLAFVWFDKGSWLKNLNGIVVFSTDWASDLESATMAQNCNSTADPLNLNMIDSGWNSGSSEQANGEHKAAILAKQVYVTPGRDCALVCAWFGKEHHSEPFLNYFGINMPDEWPEVDAPVLVLIDVVEKTVEFKYAPFPLKQYN